MTDVWVSNDISHNLNINQKYLNNFSLLKNPVKVKEIRKVPYKGNIYDVTVKNHIIQVKRNGIPVWSGNSNDDLQFLEIKCGTRTLDYEWINKSVFRADYECDETGYLIPVNNLV